MTIMKYFKMSLGVVLLMSQINPASADFQRDMARAQAEFRKLSAKSK